MKHSYACLGLLVLQAGGCTRAHEQSANGDASVSRDPVDVPRDSGADARAPAAPRPDASTTPFECPVRDQDDTDADAGLDDPFAPELATACSRCEENQTRRFYHSCTID